MLVELVQQQTSLIDAEILITLSTPTLLESDPKREILKRAGFKAEQDQVCALHDHALIVGGCDELNSESIRSALSSIVKILNSCEYKSAKIALYGIENTKALVEGFILGGYSFDDYKSKPKPIALKNIYISNENYDQSEIDTTSLDDIFKETLIIARATNFTRDLVNTIPNDMTPQALAVVASDMSDDLDLDCAILDEYGLEDENMNAMLAVGRASIHKPRLIHVAYKPQNPKKVITLIGKGLTYDSGGMSLKAPTSMVTMKMDKAGACAVLGILRAASELKLPFEIHGFIGAAENMVNSNAYKPDDVLVSRSGKTIEVRNTDAEGRLVLCDVLNYAQEKVKADVIFDYATLTGACMVALGAYTTGVMGHSNKLKHQIFQAAKDSGEFVGALPFNRHLKKLLKSDVADICNVSSKPYGGAITAALFLDNFIDEDMKDKWLHFDIAGSAYTETPWDCHGYGATGAGVRMTLEWLKQTLRENDSQK